MSLAFRHIERPGTHVVFTQSKESEFTEEEGEMKQMKSRRGLNG